MESNIDIINDVHNHSINIKSREIFLHSQITHTDEENPGIEYRMTAAFIKNITILDAMSDKPIVIHLFSIGGDWGSGMAIYDSIRMCRSHVSMLVYGQSESMGSIILQAADKRVMTPHSYFMAHYGNGEYAGNYLDAQNAAKMERVMCNAMFEIYVDGMVNSQFIKENYPKSITRDKAKNFLSRKLKGGDWYLSPQETIYYGFADCIIGSRCCEGISDLKYVK